MPPNGAAALQAARSAVAVVVAAAAAAAVMEPVADRTLPALQLLVLVLVVSVVHVIVDVAAVVVAVVVVVAVGAELQDQLARVVRNDGVVVLQNDSLQLQRPLAFLLHVASLSKEQIHLLNFKY